MKIMIKILKILLLVLLAVVLVNIVQPAFTRRPDPDYLEAISHMAFESERPGCERILCIDENEEALLWRLRMIGNAEKSLILSTFDLRPDQSGTDILAALYHAAERGVNVKILIDGVYQMLYLRSSPVFLALAAHENVEARIYNPVIPENILRLNYRMHDKYLIVDDRMYLLGGRNTNDIFLGDRKTGINVDRDMLVYDTSGGKGESLLKLREYFERIWEEPCVRGKRAGGDRDTYAAQYEELRLRYAGLLEEYPDMESFDGWEEATCSADKITLLDNGTAAGRKAPQILQAVEYLALKGKDIIIQTPYVICDGVMYDVLQNIADHAELKIILNAVEKGSNPWGCTDYLNNKSRILKTGANVYELLNEHAVHTKAVLVDETISIVGSYNFDIRSTYLDTELMLVIDSEDLNDHIRKMEELYMAKSREVLSGGQETEGRLYERKELDGSRKLFYDVLKVLIRPIRHLL